MVTLGFNYEFGGYGAPVTARYSLLFNLQQTQSPGIVRGFFYS
jgi:hypothetical protein